MHKSFHSLTLLLFLISNLFATNAFGKALNYDLSDRSSILSKNALLNINKSKLGKAAIKLPVACPTFATTISIGGTATTAGSLYPSLTAAIAELSACGITQPIILSLNSAYNSASETFPITIPNISGSSSINTITIKPAGSPLLITGNSASGIFILNGTTHLIIDGSTTSGGSTRDLIIRNDNGDTGNTITLINGAANNVIKNTNLLAGAESNAVIAVSTSFAAFGNNNNTVQNNSIAPSARLPLIGIYNFGTAGKPNRNNIFKQNEIKDFSQAGIQDDGNSSGSIYEGNSIFGTQNQTSTNDLAGILLFSERIELPVLKSNRIYDLKSTAFLGAVFGINLFDIAQGSTVNVVNNMISLSGGSSTSTIFGILDQLNGNTAANILFNSVNIFGSTSFLSSSAAYSKELLNTSVVKNNIFKNTRTSSEFGKQYAISWLNVSPFTSDHNDLYSSGSANNVIGLGISGNLATLAIWQSVTGQDLNSITYNSPFISATDLHIAPTGCNPLESAAAPIAGITTDFDGEERSTTTPDIGADEFTGLGQPKITSVTAQEPSLCSTQTTTITANGVAGANAVVTWYSGPNATGTNYGTGLSFVTGPGTYFARVTADCGVAVEASVTVANGDTAFTANSGNWSIASNWLANVIPDETKCIVIPTGKEVIVDVLTAAAKSVTVQPGAQLRIKKDQALTVQDEFINNATAENVVIESDGNLVQVNNVVNTTAVSSRRLHTLTDLRREYNFVSSPVANQNMKLSFGNNAANIPFVTVLRENTNSFVNATAADYAKTGKGFSVREPKSSYVDLSGDGLLFNQAQYQGIPNNGDIPVSLDWSVAARGYNLAGNPYPSNVDIVDLYNNSTKTLIEPSFRFWDNTVNDIYVQMGGAYQGYSYAFFNAETTPNGFGIAAPGKGLDPDGNPYPAGTKIPTRVIKVSQAFMVRATGNGASLNFKNTQRRTTNTGTVFYGKESTDDVYRLQLVTPEGLTIQNGIAYFTGGNQEFGREDTRTPNSQASDALFSFAGDAKVLINGKPIFTIDDVVKLGLRHFTGGTYKIQAVGEEGIFANGQSIYLKDKELGIYTDLTAGDYSFSSNTGEFTNRFEIVYRPGGGVLGTEVTAKEDLVVYRENGDFVVKAQSSRITNLEVYDMNGRLLMKLKPNATQAQIPAGQLVNGTYILKVEQEGKITSKKIIK